MRRYFLAGTALLALVGPASAGEMTTGYGSIIGKAGPGQSIIRLDVGMLVEAGIGGGTNNTAVALAPNGQQYTVKNDHYGMMMYARIFPSYDAQTPGGLRYGAAAEVRGNNNTGASGGVGVGTASQRTTNTLYWNRAYGYLGGDNWGILRFGMVDGPIGLMKVGTFEGFGDGGLNRSNQGLMPPPDSNIWRFPISISSEYSSQKFSYTTPTWAGFDFGASFAPSTATHQGSDGGTVVTGGSARGATSVLGSDANRYRNMYELMARYRNTFGPVGVAATAGYLGSNRINVPGSPKRGLSIFDTGAQVSYMGFSFGGHLSSGVFNGTTTLSAPGEKTATVWLLGAQYESGPWILGGHYLNAVTPGSLTPGDAALHEDGFAIGLSWAWAPGVKTYIEGLYVNRKQPGANLRLGVGPGRDSVNASQIMLGQVFRW